MADWFTQNAPPNATPPSPAVSVAPPSGDWFEQNKPVQSGTSQPGGVSRFISGVGEGSGISGLWDSLKNVSGAKTISDAKDEWDKGNHANAIRSLIDFAIKGGPAGKIASGMVDTSADQISKATKAVKEGRYNDAFMHANGALLPMIAPAVDSSERIKQPGADVAHEAGVILGNVGSVAVPALAETMLPETATLGRVPPSLTAEEQAAVDFAKKQGDYATRPGPEVPIPASTSTGDKFVKGVQAIAANQPLGAPVAKAATQVTRGAMEDTASQLADEASRPGLSSMRDAHAQKSYGVPYSDLAANEKARINGLAGMESPAATEESAGAATAAELATKAAEQATAAREAYLRLSEIENDPANIKEIQTGTKPNPNLNKLSQTLTGRDFSELGSAEQKKVMDVAPSFKMDVAPTPVTQDMALPVDMRPVKAALQPIYDELKSQMPVAQQQASRGLRAIENIVNGDDHAPASVAEANLGAVKAIQREAVNARTKYLAGQAIQSFGPAVDSAVAGAGSEAADALAQGRAMTKAKYATQATLDQLPTEPVKLFNSLTANQDTAINLLRDVQSKAPDAIPSVGRAYVQGLLDAATAPEGTAPGPAAAFSNWNKLGDATKQILFPDPALRKNLDAYFSLAKKVAENPNPSGSAVVAHTLTPGIIALHNPITGVAWTLGGYGLAKLLYSPQGVALLSRGLKVPISEPAAAASVASQIVKLAGNDAKVIQMPKAAGGKSASPEDIRDYASAKGITEDAARKEFTSAGYQVQQ